MYFLDCSAFFVVALDRRACRMIVPWATGKQRALPPPQRVLPLLRVAPFVVVVFRGRLCFAGQASADKTAN